MRLASLWVGNVDSELLHTYIKVDPLDVLVLCVRLAVLVAVTLTVPVVLFPVRRPMKILLYINKDTSCRSYTSNPCNMLLYCNIKIQTQNMEAEKWRLNKHKAKVMGK